MGLRTSLRPQNKTSSLDISLRYLKPFPGHTPLIKEASGPSPPRPTFNKCTATNKPWSPQSAVPWKMTGPCKGILPRDKRTAGCHTSEDTRQKALLATPPRVIEGARRARDGLPMSSSGWSAADADLPAVSWTRKPTFSRSSDNKTK